jgi:hypothetical protein
VVYGCNLEDRLTKPEMVAPPNHNRARCHSLVVEKTSVSGPLIGKEETALLITKRRVVARHISVP